MSDVFEVCQISLKNEDFKSGGLFGSPSFTVFYVAEKISPMGDAVIGMSPKLHRKINLNSMESDKVSEQLEQGYKDMLAQLLSDGWEPVGVNDDGKIMTLKRRIEQ